MTQTTTCIDHSNQRYAYLPNWCLVALRLPHRVLLHHSTIVQPTIPKQPYLPTAARTLINTPQLLHASADSNLSSLRRLLRGRLILRAAAAVAYRRHRASMTAEAGGMHQTVVQPSKTILLTVAFDDAAAEVLAQHTGWHHLQDNFQVFDLSGAANRQQAAADCFEAATASTGRAAAAVVAPVAQQQQIIQQLRAACATLFIVCWHPNATEDAAMRWQAFQDGANMVTRCGHAVTEALHRVSQQQQQQQQQLARMGRDTSAAAAAAAEAGCACVCDWCGLPALSAAEYWMHQQLYHINHTNKPGTCQVCGKFSHNLARHLHDRHDPTGRPAEQRTGVFALAIVRRPSDGKFLMTQEFAGSGFWVPGGGVEPGESLVEGALRECREEAGVDVVIRWILDLESHHGGSWRRIIFFAEPAAAGAAAAAAAAAGDIIVDASVDTAEGMQQQRQQQQADLSSSPAADCPQQQQQQQPHPSGHWHSSLGAFPCCSPKTLPDWESAGACWVSADELSCIPLRSASEPLRWFALLAGGVEGLREQLPLIDSLELPAEWAEGVFEGFPCQRSD